MESEPDCLLVQFERTLWISDSEAGLKEEKSGGVVEGEGECGDDVVWLLSRDRRSLDILKGHIPPPIFGPCLLWRNGRPSRYWWALVSMSTSCGIALTDKKLCRCSQTVKKCAINTS